MDIKKYWDRRHKKQAFLKGWRTSTIEEFLRTGKVEVLMGQPSDYPDTLYIISQADEDENIPARVAYVNTYNAAKLLCDGTWSIATPQQIGEYLKRQEAHGRELARIEAQNRKTATPVVVLPSPAKARAAK